MTFTGLIAFIGLLLGFGFLIFVHELGHFLVAKWAGVKCTQFAIGFGHSVLTYRKGIGFRVGSTEKEYEQRIREHLKSQGIDPASLPGVAQQEQEDGSPLASGGGGPAVDKAAGELGLGETEYRFNWMPLGGYVKMLGQEDMDPAARSADPRSFNAKSIGARAAVISAGVVMNVIVGVGFFIVAFMSGVEFPPAVVGGVNPDMPGAHAYAQGHENDPEYQGLRVGDRVTHINQREINDWPQLQMATALGARGEALDLTIQRPGHDQPLHYRLTPVPGGREDLLSIGAMPPRGLRLGEVLPHSQPARAGVGANWRAVAVEGEPIEHYHELHHAVVRAAGRPVAVTFAPPNEADADAPANDADAQPGRATGRVTVELTAQPRFDHTDRTIHLAGLVPAAEVPAAQPGYPAAAAGVEAGDVLARLGGRSWPSVERVPPIVAEARAEPVPTTVWRDGERVTLEPIRPQRTLWAQLTGGGGMLGVRLAPAEAPIVSRTLPDTPAAALELPAGSRILALGDEPVNTWADVQRVLASLELPEESETLELAVQYELDIADRPREQDVLTFARDELEHLRTLGWQAPRGLGFVLLELPVRASNPWHATVLGIEKTGEFLVRTYQTLLRLIQGTVRMEHLRGPVGIVDVGTQVAQERGWQYVMFFLGLISVNLAVINFLPIPIVDGGHMVFLLVEKLKGSPVSPQVQVAATYLGLALIAFVFITVLFYDVARLMGG